MPRVKKDGPQFTIKMNRATYDRLEAFCEHSERPKTVAIESANVHDRYDDMVSTYEKKESGKLK